MIDNRGGQGGVLGTDVVGESQARGYTIGVVSAGALAICPSNENFAYETLKDLAADHARRQGAGNTGSGDQRQADTMKDLVALVNAQPVKFNFARPAPAACPPGRRIIQSDREDRITHVPYRGAAPAANDLLGEQVQMVFLDLPVLLPQTNAGKFNPIAVGAPKRVPSAPNVPTTAEVGMPGLLTENWYGMVAPANTPPDVVAELNKAAVEAMKDKEVDRQAGGPGREFVGGTPEEFRAFIDSETKKWAKVIKDAGVPTFKNSASLRKPS